MLKCEICGKEYKMVTSFHLAMHGLTTYEYKALYPDAVLCEKAMFSEKGLESLREHWRKVGLANKGQKEPPEAVARRAASLRGRSYEDLMGKEKADKLKEDRRRCFDWVNTPELRLENALRGSMRQKELMDTDPEHRERFCEKRRQSQKRRWAELDEEGRAKWMRDFMLGRRRKWAEASEEERTAWISPWIRAAGRKPNKLERYLGEWLDFIYPGEWKYVGDGEVIIGGLNPDFVNVNGKKQIIELFGTYWHSKERTGRTPKEEELWRKRRLGEYGYKTLIIWEHELTQDMMKVAKRINCFIEGEG